MSRGNNILSIQPRDDLKFPFQLNKQTSCCLDLANQTRIYLAFQVKTRNPKKYCISPNMGTILPKRTCNVMITMQAHKEAPQDMLQCKDKFLVQMFDLREMFKEQSAKAVFKEFKLRATYVPVGSVTTSRVKYALVRRGPEQEGSSPPTGTASS
ncbi:hypothetical protein MKW98_013332 [Papaver atlanticum]|uniref:MSP domain-containing protein n=1 Tax=Papaver atlanticum TaxID=357466 RepID=A0AAD4SU98_9MAGN|nr:hypothetical protein MKW98_013332 [Papaver atlanticum]